MPFTESYPFRRVAVDHAIVGTSRIWWQLAARFNDPGPHTYQLQAGVTGLSTATDWVDVGSPIVNTWYAEDDSRRLYGKRLLTHYRVVLVTSVGKYVSNPAAVYGQLPEADWVTAREILRKEQLRLGKVAAEGVLLKRLRHGSRCDRCLDTLTNQVTDSRCPVCRGVGYKVGYYAPMPLQCWVLSPQPVLEQRNGAAAPGQSRPTTIKARVMACPDLALEDVWVNAHSDERWSVDSFTQSAACRGVPLILDVTLNLLPYSDIAYRIPVGPQDADSVAHGELPTAGSGCETVTHDYGGTDELAYHKNGCGVVGAYVYAFRKADYDNGLRLPAHAVAATTTVADGRWAYALKLNAGDYVLVYEKPGETGPDAHAITVTSTTPASSSSSSTSFGPV